MAVVRRQKGDKTRETKKGNLVVTRANGTVVKLNKNKGTITRTKPGGKVVKQKLTAGPTKKVSGTGSVVGSRVKWNIGNIPGRKTNGGGR